MKQKWTEAREEVSHNSWREDLILGIVGKEPSGWLWGVVPFVIMLPLIGAANIPSSVAGWAFPLAFGIYLLRCTPYWLRKRELRKLGDRDLQKLFTQAKGIDINDLRE